MNFTTKAVEALTLQRNGQFQKKPERSMILLINPTRDLHMYALLHIVALCAKTAEKKQYFFITK